MLNNDIVTDLSGGMCKSIIENKHSSECWFFFDELLLLLRYLCVLHANYPSLMNQRQGKHLLKGRC